MKSARMWSRAIILAAGGALALAGCTNATDPQSDPTGSAAPSETAGSGKVTVLSYDSLDVPEDLPTRFKEATGYDVEFQQVGDAGELTNKLVLTKDNPLGDVAFGIDNISAYRAVEAGVFDGETPDVIKEATAQPIEGAPGLVAFDYGDVCVNYDKKWFADKGLEVPSTFDDLKDEKYRDLLVAMNPTSSSPGLAFMVATIEKYGDQWPEYWAALRDNGVKITQGWSEAFSVDYSAGEGGGAYPLMVSYSSSPAFSVNEEGTDTSTGAMLDTCFRQTEYMGMIAGSKNPEGAKAFMKFMLEPEQQKILSEVNYMYPVNPDAEVPEDLKKFGPLADNPHQVDAKTIVENNRDWLAKWAEVMGQ